jgi:CBS-domain-containing membrane protein
MSDIKEIFAVRTGWRKLFDHSFQFFQFLRMEQGIAKGKDSVPSFTVTPDTTLINVIKKMAAVKSHQVWVVESSAHDLMGVISVADVMPLLV